MNTQENTKEQCPTEQPVETTNRQQSKIGRLCGVADQGMYRRLQQPPSSRDRLHSTLNVSPVHLGVESRYRDGEYQRYNSKNRRYSSNICTEHHGGRRFSSMTNQDRYNVMDNSLVMEVVEKIYRQPLVTAALNTIMEFDGADKSSTIPWLDQVEMVVERNSADPVEVGISKLVGIPLRNVITIE